MRLESSHTKPTGASSRCVSTFLLLASFGATLSTGCVTFDEFPEGDLCKQPFRDEEGRALYYPESRLCPARKDAGTTAEDDENTSDDARDGGAE